MMGVGVVVNADGIAMRKESCFEKVPTHRGILNILTCAVTSRITSEADAFTKNIENPLAKNSSTMGRLLHFVRSRRQWRYFIDVALHDMGSKNHRLPLSRRRVLIIAGLVHGLHFVLLHFIGGNSALILLEDPRCCSTLRIRHSAEFASE